MKRLTEVDLHLYLAKAMPWRQRVILRAVIFFNDGLRGRLQEMQKEISAFQTTEQRRLGYKLFADEGLGHESTQARARQRAMGLHPRWRLAMSAAFAMLLAVGIWPLYETHHQQPVGDESPLYTAKGSPLELALFIKGDTLRRVQGHEAKVAAHDTLQLMPPGGSKPFVAIYGFEAGKELTRLFPTQGNKASQVTNRNPPPGLVISGGTENHLVCVAQEKEFALGEVESRLRQAMTQGLLTPTGLPKAWHVQTFVVQGEP